MKKSDHITTFEFVAKINGRVEYVDQIQELYDSTLIAKVRVC